VGRVLVASAGYLGDVAPFVPIANALSDRGHDVTFLTPPGFHPLLAGERFGLATYPLDLSPSGMRGDPRHDRLMRHPLGNTVALGRYLMAKGFSDDPVAARRSVQDALEGADVLVTHPSFATVAQPLAEAAGVPVVFGHLFPMLLPTRAWGPAMPSRHVRLGPCNRAAWGASAAVAHLAFRGGELNRFRRSLGVEPAGIMRLADRADRIVMLVAREYFGRPAPPDWPAMRWAGFSIWPGPAGAGLDPGLVEFLDAGDPPVLVTLGTSAAMNAGEQFAEIAAGLDSLGLRSVLLVGGPENRPLVAGRAGVAEFAPIVQLLPRCRAAVVSGALGSVAAAIRAGVPMVVHPQLVDQYWHGQRVQDLGVGRLVRRTRDVARAVRQIVDDPSYSRAATVLAADVAGQDGAATAADVVEDLLAARGRRSR